MGGIPGVPDPDAPDLPKRIYLRASRRHTDTNLLARQHNSVVASVIKNKTDIDDINQVLYDMDGITLFPPFPNEHIAYIGLSGSVKIFLNSMTEGSVYYFYGNDDGCLYDSRIHIPGSVKGWKSVAAHLRFVTDGNSEIDMRFSGTSFPGIKSETSEVWDDYYVSSNDMIDAETWNGKIRFQLDFNSVTPGYIGIAFLKLYWIHIS